MKKILLLCFVISSTLASPCHHSKDSPDSNDQIEIGAGPAPSISEIIDTEPAKNYVRRESGPDSQQAEATITEETLKVTWKIGAGPAPFVELPKPVFAYATLPPDFAQKQRRAIPDEQVWEIGAGPAPTQIIPEPQYAEANLVELSTPKIEQVKPQVDEAVRRMGRSIPEESESEGTWQIGAGPAPFVETPKPRVVLATLPPELKEPHGNEAVIRMGRSIPEESTSDPKSEWSIDAGPAPTQRVYYAEAFLTKEGTTVHQSVDAGPEPIIYPIYATAKLERKQRDVQPDYNLNQPLEDNLVGGMDDYDTFDPAATPSPEYWATLGREIEENFRKYQSKKMAEAQTTTSSSMDTLEGEVNKMFWKEFGKELRARTTKPVGESNVQDADYNIQDVIDATPIIPGFDWKTFSEKLAAEYNRSKSESSTLTPLEVTTIPPGFWKNIRTGIGKAYTNAKTGINYINPLSNPGPKPSKKPILNVDNVDQSYWSNFEDSPKNIEDNPKFWQNLDIAVEELNSRSTTPESVVQDYDLDDENFIVPDEKPTYIQPLNTAYTKKPVPLTKSDMGPGVFWTRGSDFVVRNFIAAKEKITKAAHDVRSKVFGKEEETTSIKPRGLYWTNYKNQEVSHNLDYDGHINVQVKPMDPQFIPTNKLYDPLDSSISRSRRHVDDSQQTQSFDLSQNLESQGFQLSSSRSSTYQTSGVNVDRQKLDALQDIHNFQITQGRGTPRYTSSLNFQIGGNGRVGQSSYHSSLNQQAEVLGQQTVNWDQDLGQQTQDFSAGLSSNKPRPSLGQQTVEWDQDLGQQTQDISAGLSSNKPRPSLGQQTVAWDQDLGQQTQDFSAGLSSKPKPSLGQETVAWDQELTQGISAGLSSRKPKPSLGQETVAWDADLGQQTQDFSSSYGSRNPKPRYQTNSGQQTVNWEQELSSGSIQSERLSSKPKPVYQTVLEQTQDLGQQTVDLAKDFGQITQEFSAGITQSERGRNKPISSSGQQTVNWNQDFTSNLGQVQISRDIEQELEGSTQSNRGRKPHSNYDQSEYLSSQTQQFQSGRYNHGSTRRPLPTYKPNYDDSFDISSLGQQAVNLELNYEQESGRSGSSGSLSSHSQISHNQKPSRHSEDQNQENLGQETVNFQQPEDYQISELSGGVKGGHSVGRPGSYQQPEDYQLSILSQRRTTIPPFVRYTKPRQPHISQTPEDLTFTSQDSGLYQQSQLSQEPSSFQVNAEYQQSSNLQTGSYQRPSQSSQQGNSQQSQSFGGYNQQAEDLSQNAQIGGAYQRESLDYDSQQSSQSLLHQSQIGTQESSNSYLQGIKGNAELSGQIKTGTVEASLNATVTEKPGFFSRVGGKIKAGFNSAKDSVVSLVSSKKD